MAFEEQSMLPYVALRDNIAFALKPRVSDAPSGTAIVDPCPTSCRAYETTRQVLLARWAND
jgi:hypothetical protein